MDEFWKIVEDIMSNGKLTSAANQHLVVTKNEDGDVQITYKNPMHNETYKQIKEYIDNLDNAICDEASKALRAEKTDIFNTLSKELNNPTDIKALENAANIFKEYVKNAANNEVESLSERINYLVDNYIN